jgi:hypothetical protein
MVHLEKFPEHLKSIPQTQWQQLFSLLDELEKQGNFSSPSSSMQLAEGITVVSGPGRDKVVLRFLSQVSDMQLAPVFDWGKWEEGIALLKVYATDYSHLGLVDLCKLLTVIIRNDRFVEGFLDACLAKGVVQAIVGEMKSRVVL